MESIVLDANVALDWFLTSDVGDAYSTPLTKLAVDGEVKFLVPLHFDIEVARILCLKASPKTPNTFYSKAWRDNALMVLDDMPIEIVAQGINFQLLGNLSTAYQLDAPDAPDVPYLHLARSMGLPIATRDKAMIQACQAWNVAHWKP